MDEELAAYDKYVESKKFEPARIYTGAALRECFECGGYGYHHNYCDKVMQ